MHVKRKSQRAQGGEKFMRKVKEWQCYRSQQLWQ